MPEYAILNRINSPDDLKVLSNPEKKLLCDDIRKELIDVISKNGGHLASNLGTIELTVAMHSCFDSPNDRFVFDVGHQCYTHKILTGRKEQFHTLRKEGGISGFTRPEESEHDTFVSGHSSTSIASALGLAYANHLNKTNNYVVAVIGDGALSGGLSYEAMNNIDKSKPLKIIVVLNDNKMSISENVGAMARHLAVIRSNPKYHNFKSGIESFLQKTPVIGSGLRNFVFRLKKALKNMIYNSNIFEDMGFSYLGPVDGHDIELLENSFKTAKRMKRPVLIHINTVKGKGYPFAEKNPSQYHGVSNLDIDTGEQLPTGDSFSACAGQILCELAESDTRICAISAAMTEGTGLSPFSQRYADRFFDVGIAEGHAVTFSSGLSKGGLIPYFAVYSSFLQRAYDQLVHDIAIQNLKSVMLIDRAGFVGSDGETHQGLFDVPFLSSIPNTVIYAPAYFDDLRNLIIKSVTDKHNGIIAIRYPKGSQLSPRPQGLSEEKNGNCILSAEKNAENAIVTYGRIFSNAVNAQKKLCESGFYTDAVKLTKIWPIDDEILDTLVKYRNIFFFEEGMRTGGIAEHMLDAIQKRGYKGTFHITAINDCFVPAASVERCFKMHRLDADSMFGYVKENINGR